MKSIAGDTQTSRRMRAPAVPTDKLIGIGDTQLERIEALLSAESDNWNKTCKVDGAGIQTTGALIARDA